ncbi:uncharacterized protein [Nicotiana tomentosiformis]|uniref:uncharacterized protein n=1 Tax=Nicotiana tomentosiformis TaxID=4098 RepID=UPI00388CCB42
MDNGKPFDNKLMNKICDLFGFKQRNSSMYYADANGLVEAFNKTLCNLLKKSFHLSVKSHRCGLPFKKDSLMKKMLYLEELEAFDEKRLEAQQILECYQAPMSRSFSKRVRLRSFQVGDQVLGVKRPIITSRRSGTNSMLSGMDHMLYKRNTQVALTR